MARRARRNITQIDLLAWPEIDEARREYEVAEVAYNEARRRYRNAPHGTRADRLKRFLKANEDALRAEGRYKRLMREAGL